MKFKLLALLNRTISAEKQLVAVFSVLTLYTILL